MNHPISLIADLAVILCLAGFITVLFQKIKQPAVLGYLIAGVVIGPYTPPFSLITDANDITILAELGVIFLMFSLGLEFSYRKLSRIGFPAFVIAFTEVLLMVLIGYVAGKAIGWSNQNSFLLGAALSISSTTIIVKALEEMGLKKHYFAELMVGVLLIEDLLAILLMVFITTVGKPGAILTENIFAAIGNLLLVIASWFLIGYLFIPYLMKKIQSYINHETLTILSVGLCLFLSSTATYFNYSAALGAFIMGSILAETSQVQKIEFLTLPIRDIFAAVFFVSVGMLINPKIIMTHLPYVIFLSLVTIFGKTLASGIGALISGQSLSDSIKLGFGMAQIGEFSFIIIGVGSLTLNTTELLYPVIVAISAITTFTTPYFIKYSVPFADKTEKNTPHSIHKLLQKYDTSLEKLQNYVKKHTAEVNLIARLLINGIIIAIICSIIDYIAVIKFSKNPSEIEQFSVWTFALLLSSPFIWAMLFATKFRKSTSIYEKIIPWIVVTLVIYGISHLYLYNLYLLIPIVAVLFLFFLFFKDLMGKLYFNLESQLIENLTKPEEIEQAILNEIAPWNSEFVRLKVLNNAPFVGQTLEECNFRALFGINIIAIRREFKTIWLPNAKERILPNDELIILGRYDQITAFREAAKNVTNEDVEQFEHTVLSTIVITQNHQLENLTIAQAGVKLKGIIVGLERKKEKILNPPGDTVLKNRDILLLLTKTIL